MTRDRGESERGFVSEPFPSGRTRRTIDWMARDGGCLLLTAFSLGAAVLAMVGMIGVAADWW
jgi:hypothetical protein